MHWLEENGEISALADSELTKAKTLEIQGRRLSPPLPRSSQVTQELVPIL